MRLDRPAPFVAQLADATDALLDFRDVVELVARDDDADVSLEKRRDTIAAAARLLADRVGGLPALRLLLIW